MKLKVPTKEIKYSQLKEWEKNLSQLYLGAGKVMLISRMYKELRKLSTQTTNR